MLSCSRGSGIQKCHEGFKGPCSCDRTVTSDGLGSKVAEARKNVESEKLRTTEILPKDLSSVAHTSCGQRSWPRSEELDALIAAARISHTIVRERVRPRSRCADSSGQNCRTHSLLAERTLPLERGRFHQARSGRENSLDTRAHATADPVLSPIHSVGRRPYHHIPWRIWGRPKFE